MVVGGSARKPIRTTNAIASGNDGRSNVFSISSPRPGPARERGERGGDLGFGEQRHTTHSYPHSTGPIQPQRRRWATLARCPSTSPTPKPPSTSSSTAPHGLTLHWADGTTSHFGLEELRRNCPCAECRGLREQGRVVGPNPRSLLAVHRRRRRAGRRLGPHDHLERRSRHRDLRLEHPAGPGATPEPNEPGTVERRVIRR